MIKKGSHKKAVNCEVRRADKLAHSAVPDGSIVTTVLYSLRGS